MQYKQSPFQHLLGQTRAKNLLGRALGSGRIAHAYLFKGPDGVGKKRYAAAMAQAINCKVSGPSYACLECRSCRKYATGNHPDYSVESPVGGSIKIDRVRELNKSLSYPPFESEKRIVVLEDIHTMRKEAANCLLKTLEEPPEDNILILTTEASKAVLATISSRCQVISFFPLSEDETVKILCSKEHGLNKEQATILARLSEGSPGRALVLHTTEMIDTWQNVTGILDNPQYKDDRYTGVVLQLAEQMAALKENLLPMLGLLRIWLRDMLVDLHVRGSRTGEAEADPNKEDCPVSHQEIMVRMKAIDRAEQQLARNCNRALVCESLLFRLQ